MLLTSVLMLKNREVPACGIDSLVFVFNFTCSQVQNYVSKKKKKKAIVKGMYGKVDIVHVYTQHLQSILNVGKWLWRGKETFKGRSWKGGVHDDSEEWACGALLSSPTHTRTLSPVQFPCPSPSSAPDVEGRPMTHCVLVFGVLGRPSSTCLTLTPTTAAAVTRLLWCRLCSRPTSWQLNIHIIHMLKTHDRISEAAFSLAVALWSNEDYCGVVLCVYLID